MNILAEKVSLSQEVSTAFWNRLDGLELGILGTPQDQNPERRLWEAISHLLLTCRSSLQQLPGLIYFQIAWRGVPLLKSMWQLVQNDPSGVSISTSASRTGWR